MPGGGILRAILLFAALLACPTHSLFLSLRDLNSGAWGPFAAARRGGCEPLRETLRGGVESAIDVLMDSIVGDSIVGEANEEGSERLIRKHRHERDKERARADGEDWRVGDVLDFWFKGSPTESMKQR